MKVQKEESKFYPVHIILESQEEVDKLYALFSYIPIVDADKLFANLFMQLSPHQVRSSAHSEKITYSIKAHS